MRPFIIASAFLLGLTTAEAAPVWEQRAQVPAGGIDFGSISPFVLHGRPDADTDLLPHSGQRFSRATPSILPRFDFGPFHATLGGSAGNDLDFGASRGGDPNFGSLTRRTEHASPRINLETDTFLGGHFSGSIGNRGAGLKFSLPMQ